MGPWACARVTGVGVRMGFRSLWCATIFLGSDGNFIYRSLVVPGDCRR